MFPIILVAQAVLGALVAQVVPEALVAQADLMVVEEAIKFQQIKRITR